MTSSPQPVRPVRVRAKEGRVRLQPIAKRRRHLPIDMSQIVEIGGEIFFAALFMTEASTVGTGTVTTSPFVGRRAT